MCIQYLRGVVFGPALVDKLAIDNRVFYDATWLTVIVILVIMFH